MKKKPTSLSVRKLLELFVTGPAVRTARLFPQNAVSFAFPFDRKNDELAQLVSTSFHMSKDACRSHQLRDPYITKAGLMVAKPTKW